MALWQICKMHKADQNVQVWLQSILTCCCPVLPESRDAIGSLDANALDIRPQCAGTGIIGRSHHEYVATA